MDKPLNILVLEDNPADYQLLDRHLQQQGLPAQCRCVVSREDLHSALAAGGWDLVLADYHLPGLDIHRELRHLQQHHPDLPVIMVSGSLGEDNAVELLKQGLWDFVLKDRPARLASAIRRSLTDAAQRRAHRAADTALEASRSAALNMMEDAIEARQHAERSTVKLQEEIAERRRMEGEREITVRLLSLMNAANNTHELMRQVTLLLREWFDCEAVGIRLQAGDDFPYFETRGFPAEFVQLENQLCRRDAAGAVVLDTEGHPALECMCGNVLRGRFDPRQPFFTARGSFWANDTTRLLATTTPADRQATTRNRCNAEGYESVALVALRLGATTYGLLQLNDRRTDRFTAERIALLERLADSLAIGIAHRQSQRQLQESEERYRLLAEHSEDFISMYDAEGRWLYLSPSLTRATGWTMEEMRATPGRPWIHPDDQALVAQTHAANLRGVATCIEYRFQCKNGAWKWMEGRCQPVLDDAGRVRRLILWAHDITARRHAEQVLRESEARYRSVVDNMREVMFQTDAAGHWTLLNRAWEEITGFTVAESLGTLFLNYIHPDDRQRNLEQFQPLIAREKDHCRHEIRYLTKAGGFRWIEVHARLTLNERDEPTGTVGTLTDITERKRGEQELRESEEKYRLLVDNASEAIYVAQHGIIQFANRKCAELTGFSEAELIGLASGDFAMPEEREHVRQHQQRLDRGETASNEEFHVRFRHGDERWFSISSVPIQWRGRSAVLNFATDITARKRAEDTLHLQSAALEAAANAIVITDRTGAIEWANSAFTAYTGYTLAEARGRNPRDLVKSGQYDQSFYRVMWSIILAGNVWHGEIVNRRKDGTLYTEDMTITPLRDAAGGITHFIAIKQDITERKNLEAHLLRTQRLESVGRLASGVAHDLNNILAPVLMAPPLLREAIRDPAALSLVDTIEASALRGANVIRQLLTFGRGLKGERTPLQLRTLVREMLRLLTETFPKNIAAASRMPADLPLVLGDATQLHQVLLNLSVNARDAMPQGGTLTFTLEPVEVTAAAAAAHPDAHPGPYIRLAVCDSGTGIAPGDLEKIFDPFFTTKPIGEGTGLGLSTVLGIVRSHGGFIQVQSTPGHGTCFNIHLPVTEQPPAPAAGDTRSPLPQGRGELVLVVDDEEDVRRMTQRMLEKNGYRIVEAHDGAEALVMLENLRQPVQAVVTDLLMPRLDGLAFIRELRRKYKRLPVLAVGGLPPPPETLRELDLAPQGFLAKPFGSAALLQALRQVLG